MHITSIEMFLNNSMGILRAKTRIQALPADANLKGKGKDLSMLSVLVRIFRKEGIFGFYRGFWATMLNTFSMRTCFFLSSQSDSS